MDKEKIPNFRCRVLSEGRNALKLVEAAFNERAAQSKRKTTKLSICEFGVRTFSIVPLRFATGLSVPANANPWKGFLNYTLTFR